MHKKLKVRASVINDTQKKGVTAFVVASAGDTLPKVETASYGCTDCGVVFASAAGMEPFCVNCGSHKVKANVEQEAPELPDDSDDIIAVRCSCCGAYNGMPAVVASTLNGHAHCVECGADVDFDTTSLQSDDQQEEASQDQQQQDADGEQATQQIEQKEEQDADENQAETAGKKATTELVKPNTEKVGQEEPDDSTVVPAPAKPAQVVVVESSQLEQNPSGQYQTPVDLVDACGGGTFSLDKHGQTLYAYVDDVPVAFLKKEQATDAMQHVFDTDSLIAAILDTAEQQGVKQALQAYNFQNIKATLPVDPFVETLVQQKAEQLQQQQAEMSEDFLQSLSVAAAALNKNLFKGKTNALKASFSQLLSNCGVKNAEAAVERVFAASADDYHKQLLQTANELQQKPVEYRNTLTEALSDMNAVLPVEHEQSNTEEDCATPSDSLHSRLERSALKPAKASESASVTASTTTIRTLAAQAGGSLF